MDRIELKTLFTDTRPLSGKGNYCLRLGPHYAQFQVLKLH